ncbi:MAG: hypothetical protein MI673_07580, partial [Thiotrichales bacterium]|nr:hypothetical protein [Thiotrichales bacterium]
NTSRVEMMVLSTSTSYWRKPVSILIAIRFWQDAGRSLPWRYLVQGQHDGNDGIMCSGNAVRVPGKF